MQLERRFIKGGQLRATKGDKPGIEGYSAVFNEQYDSGWMMESIKPGAFTRALKEKQDVRCLFNHDANNVLGRTKSGTLKLTEDSTGLHFACDTNPDIRIAADVQGMIDRGDVDGCSFAFQVTKQTWREEKDSDGHYITYREIEDVDLFDVGPVTYPAYEGTSVSGRAQDRAGLLDGAPVEIRARLLAEQPVKPAQRDAAACDCACAACQDGRCEDCDCASTCEAENCSNDGCSCGGADRERVRHAEIRLRISEASL